MIHSNGMILGFAHIAQKSAYGAVVFLLGLLDEASRRHGVVNLADGLRVVGLKEREYCRLNSGYLVLTPTGFSVLRFYTTSLH